MSATGLRGGGPHAAAPTRHRLSAVGCHAPDCDRRAVLVCGRCRRVFCPRHTRPPEDGVGFLCAACVVTQPVPAGLPDECHRTPAGAWMKR